MKKKLLVLLACGILFTACSEKEIVDIAPNEVAYEVNNFSDDKTQKFDGTRESYAQVKSASKMIIVPKEKISTGVLPGQSRRLPVKKIIVVKQSISSKEWVKDVTKGSNRTDDSFSAGSSNGAEFSLGITASAKVLDTDKYVSIYGINPNADIKDVKVYAIDLETVMERTVKPFIQGELSAEFGRLSTGEIQPKKNDVIAIVAKRTKERFAQDGIEILTFNLSGDITWVDSSIQNSINDTARLLADRERVEAQQKVEATQAETKRLVLEQEARRKANEIAIMADAQVKKAEAERVEQDTRNKIAIDKASADREIALQRAKVIDIEKEFVKIEIDKNKSQAILINAQAELKKAERWDGVQPGSKLTITGANAITDKSGNVQTLNLVK